VAGTIAYCFRVSCAGFHEQQQRQMLEKNNFQTNIALFAFTDHLPTLVVHIIVYSTASSVPLDSRRGVGGNNNIKALKTTQPSLR